MGGQPSRSAPRDQAQGRHARPEPYARPPPRPKPTQAELLDAAEAQINDIMRQGVAFWDTCMVSTLEEARIARFADDPPFAPFLCLVTHIAHNAGAERRRCS